MPVIRRESGFVIRKLTGLTRMEFLGNNWARLFVGKDDVLYISPDLDIMTCTTGLKRLKNLEAERKGLLFEPVGKSRNYRVHAIWLPDDCMRYLKFVPHHWLGQMLALWNHSEFTFDGYLHLTDDFHHFEGIVRTIAVFRKQAPEWLRENKKMGRAYHDVAYWLPIPRRDEAKGLADYLMRYRQSKVEYLRAAAANWNAKKPPVPPKQAFEELLSMVATNMNARNRDLFREAWVSGILGSMDAKFVRLDMGGLWNPDSQVRLHDGRREDPAKYDVIESRWLKSQSVPPIFPGLSASKDGYVGRFLPRDDPRGLFLGVHTNCCQYPDNCASTSAWHGQEDPNGGFFVVEDQKGTIWAQSWVWVKWKSACFDSIETRWKNIPGDTTGAIAWLYEECGKKMVEEYRLKEVSVGPTNGIPIGASGNHGQRVSMGAWVPAPRGIYSDAKQHRTLVAYGRNGADGGNCTHKPVKAPGFEPGAVAVSPRPHLVGREGVAPSLSGF